MSGTTRGLALAALALLLIVPSGLKCRTSVAHRRKCPILRGMPLALSLPPLATKEDALMNRNRTIGLCLTLFLTSLLIGGLAFDASAQQPTAPAPLAASPSDPKLAAPAPDTSAPSSSTPQSQPPAMQPGPSTNVQTETRTEKTERIVEEREPGTFLGVNPTIALMVGAALLVVIVFAFVSMSRRKEEVRHTHHTHTGI